MSQNSNYFHFLYATFAVSLLLTLSYTIIVQIKKCDFFPSHFLAEIIKKRKKINVCICVLIRVIHIIYIWLRMYMMMGVHKKSCKIVYINMSAKEKTTCCSCVSVMYVCVFWWFSFFHFLGANCTTVIVKKVIKTKDWFLIHHRLLIYASFASTPTQAKTRNSRNTMK